MLKRARETFAHASPKMASPQLVLTCWDDYFSIQIWDEPAEVCDFVWHALLVQSSFLGKPVEGIFGLHKA